MDNLLYIEGDYVWILDQELGDLSRELIVAVAEGCILTDRPGGGNGLVFDDSFPIWCRQTASVVSAEVFEKTSSADRME